MQHSSNAPPCCFMARLYRTGQHWQKSGGLISKQARSELTDLNSTLDAGCHSRLSNTASREGIICVCTASLASNTAVQSLLSSKIDVACSSASFVSGLQIRESLRVVARRLTMLSMP